MGIKASALHQAAFKGRVDVFAGGRGEIFPLSPLKPFHAQKLDIFAKLIALYSPFPPKLCAARWLVGLHEVEMLQLHVGLGWGLPQSIP